MGLRIGVGSNANCANTMEININECKLQSLCEFHKLLTFAALKKLIRKIAIKNCGKKLTKN
jgi:hypothetical protein